MCTTCDINMVGVSGDKLFCFCPNCGTPFGDYSAADINKELLEVIKEQGKVYTDTIIMLKKQLYAHEQT